MSRFNISRGKLVDNTKIARVIFNAAESMGISDRDHIEKLTNQVIERLERPRTLPGMEHLISEKQKQKHIINEFEILSVVRDFLAEESLEKGEPVMIDKMEINTDIVLTKNALHVLERRYLKKDKQGNVIETPQEMFSRVAQAIASAELKYDPKAPIKNWENEFYRIMANLEFLPNSPTLMNAGRELGQLSACFVLPIEDSMESIFETVKNTALIHKSGGGTGFSFSRLRPEKDRVGSTGGIASGPVSFMRAFDVATDVIKQGGTRRGANMAILNVNHPDIMRFITSKEDTSALTNFNISVAVTAMFMEAVENGSDYDLLNPHTGGVIGQLNAKEVFDKIVTLAWQTGDPGIVFIDRINEANPTPHLGRIESTNPCGEQPLLPYESCNLGSLNLSRMLVCKNGTSVINYKRLAEVVKIATRFLDNVIDINKFPLTEIEEMTKKTRKIGLGVMGFADMLLQLGVPYNSEEALFTASQIMEFIDEEANKASVALAEEKGSFPAFEGSIYDITGGQEIRNASRTTIAPTGTLSLIAGCSSGIEPLFALSYTRNILDGTQMVEINPYFEKVAKQSGFFSEDLMQKLANGVHLTDVDDVPDDSKKLFVTAHEIDTRWHIRMQAAFQQHTDNAVSKTINFPSHAKKKDIAEAYMMAYKEGLKGITIYRDRSRDGQVLTTGKVEAPDKGAVLSPRRRTRKTSGITEKVNTGCGHLYVTVNSDQQGICEVFSHLGKAGGCASAQLEATCRLISLALRAGVDVTSVVKQLRGIRCPSIAWEEGKSVLSCADAISSVLEKHIGVDEDSINQKAKPVQDFGLVKNIAGQCPDCGNLLVFQEGCFICPGCGYTKC
jgi:ribonucleoside-diphosphate reductase alpha chain